MVERNECSFTKAPIISNADKKFFVGLKEKLKEHMPEKAKFHKKLKECELLKFEEQKAPVKGNKF